ncbi:type II toxin-antitoxin system HipA family toxin [Caulobacter sp. Root1472]|uniref:type II toxin-antitoxin system HipA family toxin n=1 Tax=Caulobacter sp. Root1472 TaxID=1736470 RepID=UPI0006F43F60|nr:type II toxin-antitoxin system HipA family toxin [Caulobacter sp. Root1472]KQZ21686.1 phosphatidylinositol kinase [Caulobacter sp. Root1472]
MAKQATVLGAYLLGQHGAPVRVGALTRDGVGATAFLPDEAWLRDEARPILSLTWFSPGDPADTRRRLDYRSDKIGLYGGLPPWFAGLLPEGALRDLVINEMGPGDHDPFDLITRLGADLPGAIFVTPDNAEAPDSAGPLRWDRVGGFRAPAPEGQVKFSLAGVQLKFIAAEAGQRFTAPARAGEGRYILKLASAAYPGLPEAEFTAMSLAKALGVRTANVRLVANSDIGAVPPEMLVGDHALAVERFDRTTEDGRIHIEDAGQILGAVGERKYTANTETVLNMIARFSTDWRDDVLEGFRRLVADILLGNGDNHLKNWSFIFPTPGQIRLSPAYDIVPTALFTPLDDTLGLPFAKIRRFDSVRLHHFRRVAEHLRLDPDWIAREVQDLVVQALDTWPQTLADLPITRERARVLRDRWPELTLVKESR